MPDYLYRAVAASGEVMEGKLYAESEQRLENRLEELGYWLIEASEDSSKRRQHGTKTPRKELIDFFYGLHSMLVAGIPITTAISAIADETVHPGFAAVLHDIGAQVEAGRPLDEAMACYPTVFNQQIINLVRAGDFGGNLAGACEDISHHLEWVERILADVRQASLYPLMILVAVLGLVFLMFAFVVPRFSRIFDSLDMELPLLTQAVVRIGEFTNEYGLLLILVGPLAVAVFRFMPARLPAFAYWLDQLVLSLPVFGQLNRMIVQSRFCHNLSLLLKSGVPILQALQLCRGVVGNRVMQRAAQDAEQAVNEGRKLTEALRRHDVISPVVLRMMVVGEETGQLDQALSQAAARFDREVPRQIKQVFSVVEPVIMISLIIIVGLIGGAVFLPMFSLMSGIGG